jgi:Glycosyltransferase family 87
MTLFATEFLVRGPARFLRNGFNDFISPFVQSKIWVSGGDPYSPQELLRFWPIDAAHPEFLSRDAAVGAMASKYGIPSPYPMTCFALLAPLSGASWSSIRLLWLAINSACALLLITALVSVAGLSHRDPRTYMFCGLALGFAPLHTAMASGNLILIASACAVIGMWSAKRGYETLTGILLSFAVCIKPTVGIVFLGYYLFSRRWRPTLIGAAVTALVVAISVLRYGLSVAKWLPSYLTTLSEMFGTGGVNDFSTANYLRFHLLNLPMPLYSAVHDATTANAIAWIVAGALLLLWMTFARREGGQELLDLSALSIIALLPVYHRFMDATLLLLPLCWCLKARTPNYKPIVWVIILFIVPFFLPGASLLATLAASGQVSSYVLSSWWWNVLLLPHEAWAILGLSLALLYAMSLARERGTSREDLSETLAERLGFAKAS